METKKLSRYGLFFLLAFITNSCVEPSKENQDDKQTGLTIKTDTNKIIADNGIIFLDKILVNNIEYTKKTITDYSQNYNFIYLINEPDTISFEENELYVNDSIQDINGDGKNDFMVTYQSTKGFVMFAYLYDKPLKRLLTSPDTLHNFTTIDDKSFFQIFDEFTFLKFEKFDWSGTNTIYKGTYLVDYSNELLHYYKIVNNDTIKIKAIEISDIEREIMREKTNF